TLNHLDEALDAIIDYKPKALLISSTKDSFIVGADITEFLGLFKQTQAELKKWLDKANDVFNKLEDLPMPTLSVVHGFALGGGCETILACDFRIADASGLIGLPETKLGIMPGFGGTVRLPRLIGAENALEWITTGKHFKADAALKVGAIDAVVVEEHLMAAAIIMLQNAMDNQLDWQARRAQKKAPLLLKNTEHLMAFSTAKAMVTRIAGRHYPAPIQAVVAIEEAAGMGRDEALEVEKKAFIKLTQTEAATALVSLFLNDQMVKSKVKKLAKSSQPYETAAVLGAGIMGGGIAYQNAAKNIPVIMKDIHQNAIDIGFKQAVSNLSGKFRKSTISVDKVASVLTKITPALDYAAIREVDIVIEAVVEHPKIKADVLQETEAMTHPKTIITSNTSTIPIRDLAKHMNRPENFCGMHFFNPVHKMPLVEVIQGEKTSAETIATICAYATKLGKTPIVVQDCAGFFVNRVLFPYFNGFGQLVRDGADYQFIDKLMSKEFGWPMGPAYLLDVVGIDTAFHAQKIMADAFPDRMQLEVNNVVDLMYKSERFGQKNSVGFYQYQKNKKGKLEKVVCEQAIGMVRDAFGKQVDFSEDDVIARCMLPMLLEVVRCYEEKIIETPAEADIALIYGLGFPPFRGGAFHYIDQMGTKKFLQMAEKYTHLGSAYGIPDGLRQLAKNNGSYYNR
ncbi:MAG: fatty acid oxidation complex subunit alpha FadB, partial [Shewanellaceae bacterium]|nr:fatty acid oxidation complex subunit alpha FadB [Shewanellaceae bacterium]